MRRFATSARKGSRTVVGAVAVGLISLSPGGAAAYAAATGTEQIQDTNDLARQLDEAELAKREARRMVERFRRSEAEAKLAARRARELAAGNKLIAEAAQKAAAAAERRAAADRKSAEDAAKAATLASRAVVRATKDAQDAEKRANGERLTRNIAISAAAAALVLGTLGLFLLRRRYSRRSPPPVANAFLRSPALNLHLPGARLPEKAGGVVVGRNPQKAEVVITEGDVSRRHARFFARDGAYWVEDLESTGGTTVDGEALKPETPVRLIPGTTIAFAGHEFKFDIDA